MLKRSQDNVTLKLKQTERFLLYRVSGSAARPLRFDLINLDGKKVSIEVENLKEKIGTYLSHNTN